MKRLRRDRRDEPMSSDVLSETAAYLWGGILDSLDLDLTRGQAILAAHVVENGAKTDVSITCRGISNVAFTNTVPWPWNYVEITEVYARRAPAGVQLQLTLWVEETTLSVTAEEIWIGDERLAEPFRSVATNHIRAR